jgi:hypothetical protein
MNISTDDLINGLIEEVKRLTVENIVLKTTLQKLQTVEQLVPVETDEQ